LLHRRDLRLGLLRGPALTDQLVNRWHIFTFIEAVTLGGKAFFAVEAQPFAHPT
jgi:hypothetical protein